MSIRSQRNLHRIPGFIGFKIARSRITGMDVDLGRNCVETGESS